MALRTGTGLIVYKTPIGPAYAACCLLFCKKRKIEPPD